MSLPSDEVKSVKLMRSPIDTHCAGEGCGRSLLFGAWIYFNPENNQALCVECGVLRGWSSKERVELVIGKLELVEDIKALKIDKKLLANDVLALKQQIDLYRLGESYGKLGVEITKLMKTAEDYLKNCGSTPEKEGLKKIFDAILECKDLQEEIHEQVENHLLRRRDKKKIEYEILPGQDGDRGPEEA